MILLDVVCRGPQDGRLTGHFRDPFDVVCRGPQDGRVTGHFRDPLDVVSRGPQHVTLTGRKLLVGLDLERSEKKIALNFKLICST